MSLFQWFRKPARPVSLPQIGYDVAYFVLPHYAFQDLAKLTDLCLNAPDSAGPFFYVMAAKLRKVDPNAEDARRFRWHHGELGDGREYFALEYPPPPPVDLSNVSVEQLVGGKAGVVLAPHFSAIVRRGPDVDYFILGQAPIGGGTTLRRVTRDGVNANLGSGPEPTLAAFLDAVRAR